MLTILCTRLLNMFYLTCFIRYFETIKLIRIEIGSKRQTVNLLTLYYYVQEQERLFYCLKKITSFTHRANFVLLISSVWWGMKLKIQ
jgi:hypothetical protein